MDNLTEAQLKEAVPSFLQTILITHFTSDIPTDHRPTLEALTTAIHCLIPAVGTWRQCHLYFGRSPFVRTSPDLELSVTFQHCVGMALDDSIYIDCFQLCNEPIEARVAAILEELCHIHLNIKSEDLVPHVVAFLYPNVLHPPNGPKYCRNPNVA
jgi:hypothetical protein